MSEITQALADIGIDIGEEIQAQIQADCCEAPNRHPQAVDTRQFLKRGSQTDAVAILQSLLNQHGAKPVLEIDHDFGKDTESAVREFQRSRGLYVDGKVGDATWSALYNKDTMGKFLTEQDFKNAAAFLGVEVAAIKAVAEVESYGGGFLADGRTKILFERHKFYKYYGATMGRTAAAKLMQVNPNICNSKAGGYKGNEAEYPRFKAAISYDETAAMLSASYGRFQIMGFNYRACGFDSVQAYVAAQATTEGAHLMAFCNFIKANEAIYKALKAKRWAAFAAGYNGADYKINNYDTKMAQAYARHAV